MAGFHGFNLTFAGVRPKTVVSAVQQIFSLTSRGPQAATLTAIGVLLAHHAAQASVKWTVPAASVERLAGESIPAEELDTTSQATPGGDPLEHDVEVARLQDRKIHAESPADGGALDEALAQQLAFEEEIGRLQASAQGGAVAAHAVDSGGSSASGALKGSGTANDENFPSGVEGLDSFGGIFKLLALLPLAFVGGGGGVSSGSAAVNDAPVGVADTLAATEDTAVTYTAAQLLGNDTDVDGDTLSIKSVSAGVGGTVVLNQDGTVTFTPAENFNGAASFSYVATDGTAGFGSHDGHGERSGG